MFGGIPVELDLKLKVVDAYNSPGVMIDALRATKIAIDRGISGPLDSKLLSSNIPNFS